MQERSDQVVLRVRGSASTEVPPDFAELSLRVFAAHPEDRARALADAAGVADQLRSDLEGLSASGPVGVEVHLSSVSVHPKNRWVGGELICDGFAASVTGCVRCAADDAAEVAEVVAAAGVELFGVRWVLDDDNPARRHVRGLAVADAERAADDYADALGRPHGELRELADSGLSFRAELAPMVAEPGVWQGQRLTLDPETVHISATVEALYLA